MLIPECLGCVQRDCQLRHWALGAEPPVRPGKARDHLAHARRGASHSSGNRKEGFPARAATRTRRGNLTTNAVSQTQETV